MDKGKIILLNGVSSSGKTILAQKLTEYLPNYLFLSIDDIGTLIFQMRSKRRQPPTSEIAKHQSYPLHLKPYIFHRLVKAISDYSYNIIIDTVIDTEEVYLDYQTLFRDANVLSVGVFCPLHELERRELARGNRDIGLAKDQFQYVHKNIVYDVEVDTYTKSVEECVRLILDKVQN